MKTVGPHKKAVRVFFFLRVTVTITVLVVVAISSFLVYRVCAPAKQKVFFFFTDRVSLFLSSSQSPTSLFCFNPRDVFVFFFQPRTILFLISRCCKKAQRTINHDRRTFTGQLLDSLVSSSDTRLTSPVSTRYKT